MRSVNSRFCLFLSPQSKNDGYWIGQNDREREGDFRYSASRRCPVWLDWRKTDPDGGRQENCLIMVKKDNGQAYDKQCNGTDLYYTLCKLRKGRVTQFRPCTTSPTP